MKTCTKCGEVKPLDAFHVRADSAQPYRSQCKDCHNASRAVYREANIDKVRARDARAHRRRLRTSYGVAESVGLELRARPCDICGAPPAAGAKLHAIDHCHTTGAVRGTLCHQCNTALGNFKDSPELLRRAALYVEKRTDYRDVDR